MDTTMLFYRWEHKPECRLALKSLNKASKAVNESSKKMWKVQQTDEENKVLINRICLEHSQNLDKFTTAVTVFRKEHESCQLVPRLSSPPKNKS